MNFEGLNKVGEKAVAYFILFFGNVNCKSQNSLFQK